MKKHFGKGLIGIISMLIIFAGAFALFTKNTPPAKATETLLQVEFPKQGYTTHDPTNLEIDLLVKKILQENGISRKAARKLHVGAIVRLPAAYGGTEYRLAEPAKGKADCVWFLAEKTLRKESPGPIWTSEPKAATTLVVSPEPAVALAPPMPAEPNIFEKFWAWMVGIIASILGAIWWLIRAIALVVLNIAIIILFLWLIARLARWTQKKMREMKERRRLNPDSYKPVIRGGLSNNPSVAGPQINRIVRETYPSGPAVVRSERGHLHNSNDSQELSVLMKFGDGQDRRVNLKANDVIWRITLADGTVLYARASCGNLISGRFELPRGWEFRPEPEMTYVAPTDPVHTEPVSPNPPTSPTAAHSGIVKVTIEEGEKKTVVEIDGDNPTGVEVGDINVYFSRNRERKAS